MALYLKDYHFISFQQLASFFKDCFSLSISQSTLSNFTAKAYETPGSFEQLVKVNLQASPVVHADETGMRAEGKTKWMHVASNNNLTHYHFDSKRGREAIEQAGVLPNYTGTLIRAC